MKRIIFLLCFLISSSLLFAQTNTLDSEWVRDNYYKVEKMIPMRDGIRLFTAIYLPRDSSEKHPVLMLRTPYSSWPYGSRSFPDFLWNSYYRLYAREQYIIVIQDVRGAYMSEGTFEDIRPFNPSKTGTQTDEASDTYDAVDWLVSNVPANNGKVGVSGISYPGFYATMAALSGHPAIKAVSPQAPVTDWFMGDDLHHNGAFFFMDAFSFYSGFGKPRPKPTMYAASGFDFPSPDNYAFYLQTGPLKNFSRLMGDSIVFWKQLMAHPDLDDWWKARNTRNFVQYIPSNTATLVVGGLFDAEDAFGTWNLYRTINEKAHNNNKLVIGPWYHGQWGGENPGNALGHIRFGSNTAEWYRNNIELPFFNYYLKGKGDSATLPEATVFFSGQNSWHKFAQWPPANSEAHALYLQPGGQLGWDKPNTSSFTAYTSDPAHPVPYAEQVHLDRTREFMVDDQRFAARRPDVITFTSDVLKEDLTLGGPVVADIFAATSTTDADFVVKLIDVFPDDFKYNNAGDDEYPMGGYQMLVRGDIMRGRYRNSFEHPSPFKPNKPEEVKFTMPDIAHTFLKGHRIMIQVQSSWFPLVDRNPQKFVNIYEANASDYQKAEIRIYQGGNYPSSVILPVLK